MGPRRVDGAPSKLAATTATRIVQDVVARGWPVGDVLGSEPELLERYGVSRAVFREAVRLVEHQQVARMRRGPGGGLVVTEPTVDAIIDAAVLYLHRVDARLDEVFAARLALEEIVTDVAPGRLDEHDLLRLRELVRDEAAGVFTDHRALHVLLAAATGNPALELFIDILNRVSVLYFSDRRALSSGTVADSRHAHARIVDAVIAGDSGLARRRMRKHLEAEAEFLRRRRSARQLLPDAVVLGDPTRSKRAEAVARAILQQLLADDLPPGHYLGSESELMERHAVSRAVFREAVRLLEHHHIAAMRRGPGGGLFVVPPDTGAVTDVVAIHLVRKGMDVADLADLRTRLELELVDLAVANMDDTAADRLRTAIDRERDASDAEFAEAGHDMHAVLAEIAGNRALELVALVLVRLTRLHQVEVLSAAARRKIADEVHRTHSGIASALIEKDAELARHRLRRHLHAVADHLR